MPPRLLPNAPEQNKSLEYGITKWAVVNSIVGYSNKFTIIPGNIIVLGYRVSLKCSITIGLLLALDLFTTVYYPDSAIVLRFMECWLFIDCLIY